MARSRKNKGKATVPVIIGIVAVVVILGIVYALMQAGGGTSTVPPAATATPTLGGPQPYGNDALPAPPSQTTAPATGGTEADAALQDVDSLFGSVSSDDFASSELQDSALGL